MADAECITAAYLTEALIELGQDKGDCRSDVIICELLDHATRSLVKARNPLTEKSASNEEIKEIKKLEASGCKKSKLSIEKTYTRFFESNAVETGRIVLSTNVLACYNSCTVLPTCGFQLYEHQMSAK